jgi:hypothetical protein
MSWTSITKDGQKMWESCNGEICSDLDSVQALENHRKQQSRRLDDLSRRDFYSKWEYEHYNDYPYEPLTKSDKIVIVSILLFGIGCGLFKFCL